MGDLATDTISPIVAILWVFYPMAALVLIELLLRAFNNDDDDDDSLEDNPVENIEEQKD